MNLPAIFSSDFPAFPSFAEMFQSWPTIGNGKLSLDVEEKNDAYHISANVPGTKKENIDVSLNDGVLTIQVKKEEKTEKKEGTYLLKERSYESTSRSVSLPYAHSGQEVEAELKDGVLLINVPKSEEKKSRKIKIK